MGPEANWQSTPCNLCMTYPLACTNVSASPWHTLWSKLCLIIPLGAGSSRDLENSVGRGPNMCGCWRSCQWSMPDRATIPILGDDLHSHLWASGWMKEPAVHLTNRFHLPESWAGTRLQDPKDQKSSTTAPKAVARDNFFWKAKDPNSLENIIPELERYMLYQFNGASDWLSTCWVLSNPCSQPYTLSKTVPSGLWGGHTNLSRIHLLRWKLPTVVAEPLHFWVPTHMRWYCIVSPIPCWGHFKKVIMSIWLVKYCHHIFSGMKQAFGACFNNRIAISL